MNCLQILIESQTRIANPENWTKERLARGKNNVPCAVNGGKALSFCMEGATIRTTGDYDHRRSRNRALLMLSRAISRNPKYKNRVPIDQYHWGDNVTRFNDHTKTTHEDVMNVYTKAIKLARQRMEEYGYTEDEPGW